MHHILFYDYVDDILDRRAPYREEHLSRIRSQPQIVMAGALGDPIHGGLFVFSPDADRPTIEAFAEGDPYVIAGLVTARRIEPWNVV